MKKYMTVAALLAAGTAFANAVDTSAWVTVDFTLVGNNTTNVTDDDVTTGRAAFATLNGLTGTFEGYSWELSFTVDAITTTEQMVYSSFGGSMGSGYALGVVSDGNGNYTYQLKEGTTSIAGKTSVGDAITTTAKDVTLVWDSESSTLSLSVGGSEAVEVTTSTALNLSTVDQTTLASGSVGGNNSVGPIFWTNGGANPLSDISLKTNTTIIPEPSAFGLLAGVGALALVAARRRRSK